MPPTLKKRRQTPDPLPPRPALSLSKGPALSLPNGPALSLSKTRRRAPTRFWVRPGHPDLDRAGDLLLAEASGWRRESVSRGLAR